MVDSSNFLDSTTVNTALTLINLAATGFGNWFMHNKKKKATIEINKAGATIKYEIQKNYLLAEIRTKHLLNHYPALLDTMHEAAAPFAGIFVTASKKISEAKAENFPLDIGAIQNMLTGYAHNTFEKDNLIGLNQIGAFNNLLATASLYISEEIYQMLKEIKKDLLVVRKSAEKIMNKKIFSYSLEQVHDFCNQNNKLMEKLEKDREDVARKMNKELGPYL